MRRRRWAALLAVVAVVGLLGACTKNEDDNEELLGYIDNTVPEPYRFIYEVEEGGERFRVQGLVQDALTYKMQLSIDGRPALEQVVVDDAVAVRFLAPGLVERFIDEDVADLVDLETDVEGASVLDALRARRWVIDPVGAPSLLLTASDVSGDEGADVADDPLFDARHVLDYIRGLARGRQPMVKYDPESLEPVYPADEDPFLPPEDGSGVERFDAVVFRNLPKVDDAAGGTTAVFPGYGNFRRMAIYVEDERVIAVREATQPSPRQVEQMVDYATALLEETAPPEVVDDFLRTVDQLPSERLGEFLMRGINTFRDSSGQSDVRFRTMALELQDLGDGSISVSLPTDEPVHASLAILQNMGRKPFVPEESSDDISDDDADGPGFDISGVLDEDDAETPDEGVPESVPAAGVE